MRPAFSLLALALAAAPARADLILSVINGNDSRAGSLRQAIIDANTPSLSGQTVTINFNPGLSVNLASFLPPLNAGQSGALGSNTNTLVFNGNGSAVNGSLNATSGFQT